MLFLAVVKDFDFFAKMKIQFKRGMVHYSTLIQPFYAYSSMIKTWTMRSTIYCIYIRHVPVGKLLGSGVGTGTLP